MLLIPAIDIKDGKCVRLRQGRMDDETVYADNPLDMAKRWVDAGARRLHLVDLDGALAGEPVNAKIVPKLLLSRLIYQKSILPLLLNTYHAIGDMDN